MNLYQSESISMSEKSNKSYRKLPLDWCLDLRFWFEFEYKDVLFNIDKCTQIRALSLASPRASNRLKYESADKLGVN